VTNPHVSASHRQDSRDPVLLRDALARLLDNIDAAELMRIRAVQESIKDAMGETWDRRAQMFEFVGTKECDAVALACRSHARLLRGEFDD
jgi:hypothetical protein